MRMPRLITSATAAALFALAPLAAADSQRLSSGEAATPLVELFTSQGCSSCPPAERWLSSLKDRDGLWDRFIPIAWHVDYWDDLGWPDRFASSAYTDRQRRYAAVGHTSGVYTPGVVHGGDEQRRWYAEGLRPPTGDRPGALRLTLDNGQAALDFAPGPDAGSGPWQAHVAILGVGLATDVRRGENRGRTLQEDFVVLGHTASDAGTGNWRLPLPQTVDANPERRAVVAWLSRPGDPAPVQAVGGWLAP